MPGPSTSILKRYLKFLLFSFQIGVFLLFLTYLFFPHELKFAIFFTHASDSYFFQNRGYGLTNAPPDINFFNLALTSLFYSSLGLLIAITTDHYKPNLFTKLNKIITRLNLIGIIGIISLIILSIILFFSRTYRINQYNKVSRCQIIMEPSEGLLGRWYGKTRMICPNSEERLLY